MTDKNIVLPVYGLPYATPTGLAKLAEQAEKAKRHAAAVAAIDLESVPADDLRYRPTIHAAWLKRIAERVVADRRAALLTEDMRTSMIAALHDDVAAAYPAADMEVLARYGLGESCNRIEVAFGLGLGRRRGTGFSDFIAPTVVPMEARWVARAPVYLAPVVRDAEIRPSHQFARPLPSAALPWFDAVYALHQERVPKIMAIITYPEKAKKPDGKWLRWGDLFDRFDLVGDWVADQRNPARVAPDRGGDCRTCDAAPSNMGEAA